MKKASPRAICLEILSRVEEAHRHPDQLLDDAFKRYRHFTPLDKAFLTELSYGTLRWRERLDWVIRHFSTVPFEKIEPRMLNILRLGLYQVLFLSRTPVSAAVNESVELAKKLRGKGGAAFVNAILRSAARKKGEATFPDMDKNAALHISVVQSHPLWLVQRWIREMGMEEALRVCRTNNDIAPLVLRANTLRINRGGLIEKLMERGLKPSPTLYSPEGIVVEDPPPVSNLPFLREGLCAIQDEASQSVIHVLDPRPHERILDACAAPGGKTTHIAQRMENKGEIYALDVTREKLRRVEEACVRLGVENVTLLKGDASKPLPIPDGLLFNRILADVPCSGFGTLRRNPDLKWRRGEGELRKLSELQVSILSNLSNYLVEGGILVYSTCTVFREENEEVIEKFLGEHRKFRLDPIGEVIPKGWVPLVRNGYLKTFPNQSGMDGFFVARLAKVSPMEMG